MTDQPCGDTVDTAIGAITCDLPAGHDDSHAGGDRTYWREQPLIGHPAAAEIDVD